jgi:ethanolamine ammonia-lyase large subunit
VLTEAAWNDAIEQLADIAAESRAEVVAAAEVLAGE